MTIVKNDPKSLIDEVVVDRMVDIVALLAVEHHRVAAIVAGPVHYVVENNCTLLLAGYCTNNTSALVH